jgi:hypothetical protein
LKGDGDWSTETTYTLDVPVNTTKIELTGTDGTTDGVILAISAPATIARTNAAKLTIGVDTMGAAAAAVAGTKGVVPASAAGDQLKFLRADATWVVPNTGDNTTYSIASGNTKVITLTGSDSSTSAVTFADGSDISISGNNGTITITNDSPDSGLPAVLTDGNNPGVTSLYTNTTAAAVRETIVAQKINYITVTVANSGGNKYYLDGVLQANAVLKPGFTYRFDQSDSTNSGHPLRFSSDSANSTPYTTGVTAVGTPGSAGAYTQIITTQATPYLYYYCTNHSGMGGNVPLQITFSSLTTTGTSGVSTINTAGVLNIPNYANDYLTGLSFNTTNGVLTATVQNQSNVTVDLDGRYLTSYTLPLASSTVRGGIKIGYTESGKNYPVELSSEKAYVNVPWTDNNDNTTYSISIPASTTKLRLTGANPASTDDVEFVGGGITTVSRTNASKFTITSTEADTLQSVTARGDTTNQRILMNGSGSDAYLYVTGNAATTAPTNSQGMAFVYNNSGGSRENEIYFNPGIVTPAENATYYFAIINEYLNSSSGNARVTDTLVKLYGNGHMDLTGPTSTATIANTFWRMPTVAAPNTGYYLSKASGSNNLVWTAPNTSNGTVTSVATGNGLSGGTITTSGTLTMSGAYTGDFTVTGDVVADSYRFRANHSNPTTSTATFYDQANEGPTISGFAVCLRTGSTPAQTGKLNSSGTFTVSGDIVAYGSPSDIRLKENIKPIESALDKVSKLQGVTFDWKNKSEDILDIKEDIGFIAQDVQKVLPELVRENDNGMLSMRHQGITPILLEAIKELKAEIEELKSNNCNCK